MYGAILKPDYSVSGPSNPATRGSTVTMFLTGLGPTSPPVPTGQLGPVPLAYTAYEPVVQLGGIIAPVLFSGIAPGFVGLDQVNFTIPSTVPVGSVVTIYVTVNGVISKSSRIAVQ